MKFKGQGVSISKTVMVGTVWQAEEEATRGGERAWKASFTGRLESEPRNKGGFSSLGKITGLTFQLA